MRRLVHNFERAQRGCAEVSLLGGRFELLRGPFGQRGCHGGLGGLALQDVEQTLFVAMSLREMSNLII